MISKTTEELIFNISDSIVPDFINTKEKLFVSVIGLSQDNKIAFVRLLEKNRSWELPGGAVVENESFIEAGEREFFEETGLRLKCAVEALKIKNVYGTSDKLHSSVTVIVGLIDEDIKAEKSTDPEIAEYALLGSSPEQCTFGQSYINNIINTAITRFSILQNHKMWDVATRSYSEQTTISEHDVHYGPLIPGEACLHLLPPLSGAHVLDLGCGAGHNLAALKKIGAKSGLGIDFCAEQIKCARERLDTSFDLILGDFSDPTYIQREMYDLVLSVFSLSFIADLENIFRIIAQNLKPGGYVVFSTDHPNRHGSYEKEKSKKTDRPHLQLRDWYIPNKTAVPYVRYLHSHAELERAIIGAGLIVDSILTPTPIQFEKLGDAPYQSSYYTARYPEILNSPYTIIFKAHKPILQT